MSNVKEKDDGQGDVSGNKITSIEIKKDSITIGDANNRNENDYKVCTKRLKTSLVGNSIFKIVDDDSFLPSKICHGDKNPVDETRNGSNVREPSEHLSGGTRHVQVR